MAAGGGLVLSELYWLSRRIACGAEPRRAVSHCAALNWATLCAKHKCEGVKGELGETAATSTGGGGAHKQARVCEVSLASVYVSPSMCAFWVDCMCGRDYATAVHTHAHMHTLTLKQPKFEIQNKCDKSER